MEGQGRAWEVKEGHGWSLPITWLWPVGLYSGNILRDKWLYESLWIMFKVHIAKVLNCQFFFKNILSLRNHIQQTFNLTSNFSERMESSRLDHLHRYLFHSLQFCQIFWAHSSDESRFWDKYFILRGFALLVDISPDTWWRRRHHFCIWSDNQSNHDKGFNNLFMEVWLKPA